MSLCSSSSRGRGSPQATLVTAHRRYALNRKVALLYTLQPTRAQNENCAAVSPLRGAPPRSLCFFVRVYKERKGKAVYTCTHGSASTIYTSQLAPRASTFSLSYSTRGRSTQKHPAAISIVPKDLCFPVIPSAWTLPRPIMVLLGEPLRLCRLLSRCLLARLCDL